MQDFERDIMRQIGIAVGESPQRTVQRQRPKPEQKKTARQTKLSLSGVTDEQLITELRNRGYEITARKIVEI